MTTMQISELKIRNRVRYKKQTYVLTGVSLNENGEYYVHIRNRKRKLYIPARIIKPVKIDESWLEKFGFIKTYDSEHILRFERLEECLKFDIDLRNSKVMSGLKLYGTNINCAYVHQFQNLFYFIFGKELV